MITRFNRDNLARNLPDAYRKDDNSNNAKILATEKGATDALREAIQAIADSLDIDKATGATLDLYGDMLNQPRGQATDEQYRILIKNKIIRSFTNPSLPGVVEAICKTFDCDPTDIILNEGDEPCVVSLEGLPVDKLAESNIDVDTAIEIIASLIPAGVEIETISFAGTFEFSGAELVYDEDTGFADEAQTMGGTLGLVADNIGTKLPV